MSIELDQLRKLPVAEKLRIVEELWDDIQASDEKPQIPEDLQSDISSRAEELRNDPSSGLTREELWKRVDNPDA
ncbi:MAG: addiction module protein [Planctomycetota bacterium]|nr:addiction module protein [Planctomycetota bacterium]MDA0919488.1 addiction module protein [Planctomycetota bacterium]MDA1159671.1 addiction module protein [Planctomycetota bacterium]